MARDQITSAGNVSLFTRGVVGAIECSHFATFCLGTCEITILLGLKLANIRK